MNDKKYVVLKDKVVIQKEKDDFQKFLQGATNIIKSLKKIQLEDNTNLAQVKQICSCSRKKVEKAYCSFEEISNWKKFPEK